MIPCDCILRSERRGKKERDSPDRACKPEPSVRDLETRPRTLDFLSSPPVLGCSPLHGFGLLSTDGCMLLLCSFKREGVTAEVGRARRRSTPAIARPQTDSSSGLLLSVRTRKVSQCRCLHRRQPSALPPQLWSVSSRAATPYLLRLRGSMRDRMAPNTPSPSSRLPLNDSQTRLQHSRIDPRAGRTPRRVDQTLRGLGPRLTRSWFDGWRARRRTRWNGRR